MTEEEQLKKVSGYSEEQMKKGKIRACDICLKRYYVPEYGSREMCGACWNGEGPITSKCVPVPPVTLGLLGRNYRTNSHRRWGKGWK